MASKKNVEPSKVRAYLTSDEGQAAIAAFNEAASPKDRVTTYVGPRGRFHPVHRDLYAKAHPNEAYVVGAFKEPVREFKHKALDKRGRNRTATARLTLAQARALIGDTGKGRLDTKAVIAKLEADAGVKPVEAATPKPTVSLDKA